MSGVFRYHSCNSRARRGGGSVRDPSLDIHQESIVDTRVSVSLEDQGVLQVPACFPVWGSRYA
jgi:hypothetical protein